MKGRSNTKKYFSMTKVMGFAESRKRFLFFMLFGDIEPTRIFFLSYTLRGMVLCIQGRERSI
jgi:hypothetical protein